HVIALAGNDRRRSHGDRVAPGRRIARLTQQVSVTVIEADLRAEHADLSRDGANLQVATGVARRHEAEVLGIADALKREVWEGDLIAQTQARCQVDRRAKPDAKAIRLILIKRPCSVDR